MKKLVKNTKVILTTVGPYQKYGELLIKNCCLYGTSYVDITGEINFVKK